MVKLLILVLLACGASVLGLPQTATPGGNTQCAEWCAANFAKNPGGTCSKLAAKGGGPCYVCGPLKTSPSQQLCSGVCTDTNTDNNNCGTCNTACPAGSTCQSGACESIYLSCETASSCAGGVFACAQSPCICIHTSEDLVICADAIVSCSLPACTQSSECQPGYVCDPGGCCGHAVCVNAIDCANPSSAKKIFRKAAQADEGATWTYPLDA